MTDFVISEELYLLIRSDLYNNGYIDRYHQLKREAHPLSEELKKERERVLDAVKHMIEYNDDLFMYMGTQILPRKVVAYKFLLSDEGIESLRGEP